MILKKCALLVPFLGLTLSAVANNVTFENNSEYLIPIAYQLAYHDSGHSVVYDEAFETIVYPHSKINVPVSVAGHADAGVVLRAVKVGSVDSSWKNVPDYATQYDGSVGCWASTDSDKANATITLEAVLNADNHGSITCGSVW